jgi:hypothetical protein
MARYIKADAVTVPQLNTELEKIEQSIQDTLSRKGDTPNAMEGTLDMNSNRVINVPDAVNAQEPLTLGQYLLSKEDSVALKDAVFVDSIKDLASVNTATNNNVFVRGFYTGTDVGGGLFYWDSTKDKTDHNGGTVLDPARITAWDGTQANLSTLFTAAGSGAGCFVRLSDENKIDIAWFGLVSDGITDNGESFQQIGISLVNFSGSLVSYGGNYATTKSLNIPLKSDFICVGATTIDGSIGSSFDFNGVVNKRGSEPNQIPNLALDVSLRSLTLSFATAHGLSAGDLILIYNPTDYSWSGFRPTYRAGEYCVIADVLSSTEVMLENPTYDSYLAEDVEVYECSGYCSGKLGKFTVIAPNNITSALKVEYFNGIEFESPVGKNSDNTSVLISKGYGYRGNLTGIQWGANPGFSTQYGVSIWNSQNGDLTGTFIGYRHGIATGGSNDFSIPCRDIHTHDFIAKKLDGQIAAADWHGNAEYCSYKNGRCYGGGVNIAGDNNIISNIDIYCGSALAIPVFGRELLGCNHKVSDCRIYTNTNDVFRGVIDVAGNSTALSENTVRGGDFVIKDIHIEAPFLTASNVVNIRNRGAVGIEFNIYCENINVKAPSLGATNSIVMPNPVSGDVPKRVSAINCHNTSQSTYNSLSQLISGILYKSSSLSGRVEVDLISGETTEIIEIQMPYSLQRSRIPSYTFSLSDNFFSDGTGLKVIETTGHDSDTLRLEIRCSDSGTFPENKTVFLNWSANISDF